MTNLKLGDRIQCAQVAFMLQSQFNRGNLVGMAMGEVGDIALVDLIADAKRLAEIDGLIGFTDGGEPRGPRNMQAWILCTISS